MNGFVDVKALCCECGTARTVSSGVNTNSHNRDLKCSTCNARTLHVIVPPAGWGDWREAANREGANWDHIYDRGMTQPPIPGVTR